MPSHRSAIAENLSTTFDRLRSRLTDDEIRHIAGHDLSRVEIELIRGPSLSSAEPAGVMSYGVSVALSRFVDELLSDYRWSLLTFRSGALITSDTPVKAMTERASHGSPSVFADVPLGPAHVLVLQTGSGGEVTAGLGGPDAWFLDETGEPSLECFQNLNFMKAEQWVFGHPDNPVWQEIGASVV